MGIKDWNAGIIRPVPVAPTGPYQDGSAPGVWTLDQVSYWLKQGLWPIAGNVNTAQRGLFGGGSAGNVINYITISSTGNATDFGDFAVAPGKLYGAACASATRGVFGGGSAAGYGTTYANVIEYVTIATTGNSTDFGDLNTLLTELAACSSATRGVFGGGNVAGPYNVLQYITIASIGNTTDFGDLAAANYRLAACASTTRGIYGGGNTNSITYITIATTGNSTTFGTLSTTARQYLASASNSTRGVFGGGDDPSNVMDYITIASTGNATDFGDLISATYELAACSSSTTIVFGGGVVSGVGINVLQYITIASTGNATDFGDLTNTMSQTPSACSGGHGGL